MAPLFRVEKAAESDGALLGYDWIEVLAIEPWALAHRPEGYGDWCDRTISCLYVCLTPQGLTRITSDDFWIAIEELFEYEHASDVAESPAIVITTGDASVVQTGASSTANVRVITEN